MKQFFTQFPTRVGSRVVYRTVVFFMSLFFLAAGACLSWSLPSVTEHQSVQTGFLSRCMYIVLAEDQALFKHWVNHGWQRLSLQPTIHIPNSEMLNNYVSMLSATRIKKKRGKICRVGLYTELFYALIPTLFLCFLHICYLYILLHF